MNYKSLFQYLGYVFMAFLSLVFCVCDIVGIAHTGFWRPFFAVVMLLLATGCILKIRMIWKSWTTDGNKTRL